MKCVVTHPVTSMNLVKENQLTILGLTVNPTPELLRKKMIAKKIILLLNSENQKPLQELYDLVISVRSGIELIYSPGKAHLYLQKTALSWLISGTGIYLIQKNKEVLSWDENFYDLQKIQEAIRSNKSYVHQKPAA